MLCLACLYDHRNNQLFASQLDNLDHATASKNHIPSLESASKSGHPGIYSKYWRVPWRVHMLIIDKRQVKVYHVLCLHVVCV